MNKEVSVGLVVPQMVDKYLKKQYRSRENLGLQYIASSLEKNNIPYYLLNAYAFNLSHEEAVVKLLEYNPTIIGISCMSQRSYVDVREFIYTLVKNFEYNGIIILGGFFPSIAYKEIFDDIPFIDFILIGEGESSLPSIVECLKSNKDFYNVPGLVRRVNKCEVKVNPPVCENELDNLAFPQRDLSLFHGLNPDNIEFKLIGGRGCFGRCSFCTIISGKDVRKKVYRSPDNLVEEIKEIIDKYNVNHFGFNDAMFYDRGKFGKEWVRRFTHLIEKNDLNIHFRMDMRAADVTKEEMLALKKAGLYSVTVGYETGVQRILDEMKKDATVNDNVQAANILRELQLKSVICFIAIVPTMTIEELWENYKFLKLIGGFTLDNLTNKLNVYYGCEYEKILADKNLLIERNKFYERHNYKYIDPKVEMFTLFIEDMKAEIVLLRKKLLKYNSDINDYSLIKKRAELFDQVIDCFFSEMLFDILSKIISSDLSKSQAKQTLNSTVYNVNQKLDKVIFNEQ